MTEHQLHALREPTVLGAETCRPRFAWREGTHSVVLTVNSGYE